MRHQDAALSLAILRQRVHVGFGQIKVSGRQFQLRVLQAARQQIPRGQAVMVDAELTHFYQWEDPRVRR